MIKPVTMYSVVCDRCGKPFIDEFNGIVAWLDEGTAKEQAMESEWAEIGDKHYCPECYEFDEKLDENVPNEWVETKVIEFNDNKEYRIKPNLEPESEYRPFKDAIECWTEMRKHKPFSILKDKKDGHRIQIPSISDGINSISTSLDSNSCFNFKYIMESCTFDDGAPFGVKLEE